MLKDDGKHGQDSFRDLIRRVRDGDEAASTELVQRYAEQVRRVVRIRMAGTQLRRVIDSQDICQSVMINFFSRVTAGQFELETPDQLFKLLTTMARNKLLNKAEFYQAGRRDIRRTDSDDGLDALRRIDATPSVVLARREIFEKLRGLLSDDERRLLDRRAEGRSWGEIAAETGDSPERIRKQLARATKCLAAQLNCDLDGDV